MGGNVTGHTKAGKELIETTPCPRCFAQPREECRSPKGAVTLPHGARWRNRTITVQEGNSNNA